MAGKSREQRAIIVGGSIAGLFAAAFLRKIGWHVDVYERSSITKRDVAFVERKKSETGTLLPITMFASTAAIES